MADPYCNLHSLYWEFQKAYESILSRRGAVLNDCPQQGSSAFGLKVQKITPSNHLNTLIPYGERFHNPFSDSRFKKVPVRVIFSQTPEQSEPLDLSQKPRAHQQADENIQWLTSQPEFSIDVPWNSGNESVNDALPSAPRIRLTQQQVCLSENEPQIRELTPASHSNPDYRLTHLPAAPSKTQCLPTVAVVNPLVMHQTTSDNPATSAEEIVDGNSSLVERQMERRQAPETRKRINQRQRERYSKKMQDPETRKRMNQRQRERYSKKMQDPEIRKLVSQRRSEQYSKKCKTPKKESG